jgi:RNA polymerase sigma-70 factor (ECF subfamily)
MYDAYGERIYRFCLRLCRNRADAEDLTQETFLAALQGLDRFAGRSSMATWLYRIAVFRWGRMRRDCRCETVPLEDAAAITGDPTAHLPDDLSLEAALDALPETMRQAFALVRIEGLKYREAAAVLGAPQGTVQYWVHEATIRLRAALKEEAPGDAPSPPTAREDLRKRDHEM